MPNNMKRLWKRFLTIIIAVASGFIASCDRLPVYTHFQPVPQNGWEKEEALLFTVSPVKEGGQYARQLGLRINSLYPFYNLCLVVEQTTVPSGRVCNDTLYCTLFDKGGRLKGKGVNYFQYAFPLNSVALEANDSLVVSVKHNMKRNLLNGITDVGFTLSPQQITPSINTQKDK